MTLEINYTDKTGTWVIFGNHVYAPENSIVNSVRHICEFCEDNPPKPGEVCEKCAKLFGDIADKADCINRSD